MCIHIKSLTEDALHRGLCQFLKQWVAKYKVQYQVWDTSPRVVVQRHPVDPPKTVQAIATALGCPLALDGKALLLKTLEGINMVLTRELSPCWLALTALEGGGKSPTIFPSCDHQQ